MARVFLLSTAFVILWNSGFIGAEYGLASTGTLSLMFWRYVALTVLLLPFAVLSWGAVTRTQAVHAMGVGVLAHAVWLSCAVLGIQYGVPAGVVALIVALQPILNGTVAGRLVGEPPTRVQWLGLAIGFAGVLATVVVRTTFTVEAPWWGYLFPFGSVVAMTAAVILQRRVVVADASKALPPMTNLFWQALASMLALALPAYVIEGMRATWDPQLLTALSWLVVGVSLGAYLLMWELVARTDATRVASLFYLGPPVTALMAWLAFGDAVRPTDALGLGMTLLGAVLVQRGGVKG